MTKRLRVLYLVPPLQSSQPWQRDVIDAVSGRHNLLLYDQTLSLPHQFEGVDVVLDHGGSMGTRGMADVAGSVKLWQILGTGIDHFDLKYWQKKGIPVANCPGEFSGVPLAECALMFMLMLSRHWHETQENFRRGVLYVPVGSELENRCLGLIGFGASARELARRAKAFGMRILAIDIRDISQEEQQEFGIEFAGKSADLDKVLAESDFVSLHLHLNEHTRHIIDDRRLKLMKPTASLINVARGALVDERALFQALSEGRLGGAGLDVFGLEPFEWDHPLLKLPNVVVTPHVSGATNGTSRRRSACAARNVDRVAAGLDPLYRVDLSVNIGAAK
jgi:phosphoglycerate dehydrogenase-like enzyme